ncbi:MAG: exodeoxyribonuclease VII large subunit, partial [Bacteroidetes bacterium]|nr:exodeoxyribonuclease VII large subunit [Bacteroidota bacterium]
MERIKGFIPLSELADLIENLVKDAFYNQSYWVVAETSDVKNYPDRGYCFVTLVEKEGKDTLARLEGVIWSKQYHIIREFEVASGIRFDKNIRLLLKVMVDFSAQYGLKLIIQDIDPSFSIGNLELEKKKILNRLLAENPDVIHYVDGNYITVNKRLTLPLALQRIALLTAPQSDGLRDFRHELEENPYGYRFIIDEYLTQIQGRRAEYQIVDQLEAIARLKNRYDIAVIARGGGSQLDFGPFDTYEAGLAVAGFNLPLITGIGHERNVSIVDMMSLLPV